MTIEDLGNLGDLIAAIATVATLLYLAQQIRRSSKSVEGSSVQAILELEITTYALKAQYANVYRRGCANILDLDDDERVIFEQVVSSEMSLFSSAYIQVQNGLMDDDAAFDRDWIRFYLKQPGFQEMWSEIKIAYSNEFCQHLDDVQKTVEGAELVEVGRI
jgi:hypothetical protein